MKHLPARIVGAPLGAIGSVPKSRLNAQWAELRSLVSPFGRKPRPSPGLRSLLQGFFLSVLFITSPFAVEPNACDLAVGHPSDPNRVGPGIPTNQVVSHVAIPACRQALLDDPDNPRLQYQLGRALYYWAEANNGDKTEAMQQLKEASDQSYVQAMFVFGLLQKYAGKACEGSALIKAAADRGLKSGRLTYVSDTLSGVYADCGSRLATDDQLLAYADAAAGQVEGYYEQMLLANLQRELEARRKFKGSHR